MFPRLAGLSPRQHRHEWLEHPAARKFQQIPLVSQRTRTAAFLVQFQCTAAPPYLALKSIVSRRSLTCLISLCPSKVFQPVKPPHRSFNCRSVHSFSDYSCMLIKALLMRLFIDTKETGGHAHVTHRLAVPLLSVQTCAVAGSFCHMQRHESSLAPAPAAAV